MVDIESGNDFSYDYILTPAILGMLPADAGSAHVLDIGCGVGALSRTVAPLVESLVGVDPSIRSIEIAKSRTQRSGLSNIRWLGMDVESFAAASRQSDRLFDIAIANMTLMNTVDLAAALVATASLCRKGAKLLWTITHPCFWSVYWGYNEAPWFDYKKEIWIEAEFKTSTTKAGTNTTHIHRPLEKYLHNFTMSGYSLIELREPMPEVVDGPQLEWPFPRFLAGSCVLV
ncbi:class I SAM-dependent methyltransferase [Nocardia brasiliensis]|uniref:class I SAM-dependent methyltransferase n=1 Tax=Nocardia brasiliensis TaxID=37326 RepID=UPI0037A8367C